MSFFLLLTHRRAFIDVTQPRFLNRNQKTILYGFLKDASVCSALNLDSCNARVKLFPNWTVGWLKNVIFTFLEHHCALIDVTQKYQFKSSLKSLLL